MHNDKLTVDEAAAMLDYHPKHVRRLIAWGVARATKVADRVWLIDRAEVERLKGLQDDEGRIHHGKTEH